MDCGQALSYRMIEVPEAGVCLVCWRDNKKGIMDWAERMKSRVIGAEIREVPKHRACRSS